MMRDRVAGLPSIEPLLLGAYAWLLTTAVPSFDSSATNLSRIACLAALLMLGVGWSIQVRFSKLSDILSIVGFCGATVGAIITLDATSGSSSGVVRLSLGAFMWALFGVSWIRARQLLLANTVSESLSSSDLDRRPPRPGRTADVATVAAAIAGMGFLVWYGIPNCDGRGTLVVCLLVLASLKATVTIGSLTTRIRQWRALTHRVPAHEGHEGPSKAAG